MENNINSPFLAIQTGGGNKKYPGPLAAGILFSLATIFLTYGGGLLAFKNNFLRSGVGEVVFILLPVLIFLAVGKYNLKETLKLRKTRPVNYLLIVFLMMFGMPIVGVFNAIGLGIIRLIFGKNLPMQQIQISDVPTLFIAILVIGIAAAVCEETLFRGLISKGYERFGILASLLTTSILFGILHRDIQKGISTILLGVLIGFIVYRTKSIYAGMVAHFTNNTVVVLLTFGVEKLSENMDINQNLDFSKIPTISLVIAIVFYAILFLVFVAAFIALLYAFRRSTENEVKLEAMRVQLESEAAKDVFVAESDTHRSRKSSVPALIGVLPGVILILFTFVGQVLELMNVNSGLIYDVLKTLWLT
ncbi:MAG: CPBP family glutamic-type intramembrane protease [Ruminiclostridium sp.]